MCLIFFFVVVSTAGRKSRRSKSTTKCTRLPLPFFCSFLVIYMHDAWHGGVQYYVFKNEM
jgi:hypothetical protein